LKIAASNSPCLHQLFVKGRNVSKHMDKTSDAW